MSDDMLCGAICGFVISDSTPGSEAFLKVTGSGVVRWRRYSLPFGDVHTLDYLLRRSMGHIVQQLIMLAGAVSMALLCWGWWGFPA